MAARIDVKLDANGDLPIEIPILMPLEYSDKRHIKDRFIAYPGWWKQFPNAGIGINSYLKANSNKIPFLKNNATLQLKADGYNVGNMLFQFDPSGKLVIAPNATRP